MLPDTMRQVVVYSERFTKDVFSDNAYWVFIALVERNGATLRVLDRHEVTGDLTLYTEFPGNFVEFGSLVTPIAARDKTIASIELWTTLSGTGSVTRGGHFFYVVSPAGKLERALGAERERNGAQYPGRRQSRGIGRSDADVAPCHMG